MGGQVRVPILEAGNLVLSIQAFELELSFYRMVWGNRTPHIGPLHLVQRVGLHQGVMLAEEQL